MKILPIRIPLIVLVFILTINTAYSQRAEVVYKNKDYKAARKGRFFDIIHDSLDISNHPLIAKLEGFSLNAGKQNLQNIFNSFYYNANELGANSFKIDTIIGARTDSVTILLSIYCISKKERKLNLSLFSGNSIYLFGSLKAGSEVQTIKLNDEKTKINPLVYFEFLLEEGEKLKINLGGTMGETKFFFGSEASKPIYVSLSGITIGYGYNGSNSIGYNVGRINTIGSNFGNLLILVLKKGN
ncbi:MAG: hypothetical protein GQ527_00475 [Bacteroidales bacterium]|nr:hypothetical protein [Bacteroidales bacterium]